MSDLNWKQNWEILGEDKEATSRTRRNLKKVKNLKDGSLGIVKELAEDFQGDNSARGRFYREAVAMETLLGKGIPQILEHNTGEWKTDNKLYIVMEYIEGPTLNDFVNQNSISLIDALILTKRITEIVKQMHDSGIYHRDIKPDNILVKNKDINSTVLLDFGLAYIEQNGSENEESQFITEKGEELGNRFLRLPELAPGQHLRVAQSDLAFLTGILFFILTKIAPRTLLDAEGKHPHVKNKDKFPPVFLADKRWPLIEDIFHIGFQPLVDSRFLSANQFLEYIDIALQDPQSDTHDDKYQALELAQRRLQDFYKRTSIQNIESLKNIMKSVHGIFLTRFSQVILNGNLVYAGTTHHFNPNLFDMKSTLQVHRQGDPSVDINVVLKVRIKDNILEGFWSVAGQKLRQEVFLGIHKDLTKKISESALQAAEKCGHATLEEYLINAEIFYKNLR